MKEQSDTEHKTALEWLAGQYPDSPRKRLKEWFAHGRVHLDGQAINQPHLRMEDPGERLRMGGVSAASKVFFKRMPTRIHAQVNLLYIDHAMAIVNKGPGLLSVPLPGQAQPSALSILENYLENKGAAELDRNRVSRKSLKPLPVHRIDQYTSGLLCFALNPGAREHLVKQVREHRFIREYLALADGDPGARRGTWRSWFKLDEEGMEQTVFDQPVPGATEAVSYFEVIDTIRWPNAAGGEQVITRLRLRLQTGLKHQLRIHAVRAGVPLLGDRLYHPDFKRATASGSGQPFGCTRQALHASSIGVIHPDTGEMKRFSCKFPRDLADLETSLRARQKKV